MAREDELSELEYSEHVWRVMGQSLGIFFACIGVGTALGSRMFGMSKVYRQLAQVLENDELPMAVKNEVAKKSVGLAANAFGYSLIVCGASGLIAGSYCTHRLEVSNVRIFLHFCIFSSNSIFSIFSSKFKVLVIFEFFRVFLIFQFSIFPENSTFF
jgi:hypothetical protein